MADQRIVDCDEPYYGDDAKSYLEGRLFTGLSVDHHPDRSKWSEVPYVDGQRHGIARSWYANGQLESETPYVRGVITGVDREWFEDGAPKSESIVESGFLMRKEVRNDCQEVIELYERPESDNMYQKLVELRKAREPE